MQFEKNLVLLRKKCGLSQEELAYTLGVTRQTIYSWEAGLNYPNIITLKKLSEILKVSTDELLNGLDLSKLPKTISNLNLTYEKSHEGKVFYNEIPNWFISLKKDEEVCWALYDLKNNNLIRDYSYHIITKDNVNIHNIEGVEIEVKEYDQNFGFSRMYNQFISLTDEGIAWLGEVDYKDNKKIISTFKDESFLKDWGIDNKFEYQPLKYNKAEDYILEFYNNKQKVIKISYYDPDGKDDLKAAYFEVFLNKDFESLVWRRYTKVKYKKKHTNVTTNIDGEIYDLDYYAITSRLL